MTILKNMNDMTRRANRLAGTAAALAAAMLLTACATHRDIGSSAVLRAPADYESAATLAGAGGAWPGLSWAADIGGSALQELIDEALVQNPGIRSAAARVAAARAMAEAAGAAGQPLAGGTFNSTWQRYTENGLVPRPLAGSRETDNRLTLDFSYDLDLWGRHAAEQRAALSQEKAADAEQQAVRIGLSTAIARAWVQLARQEAQLSLLARQIEVRQELDRLTRLRVAAGLDSRSENEQARQQLATLRAEQAQWQEAQQLTRNQLAALLGQGPDRGQRIVAPVLPAAASAALPAQLPLGLLGRRPDIVAARWRVEAAQGDIDSARAQFYPNINLVAFAGFSSLGLSNLLAGGSQVAGVGPAVRLPLFESGGLRAQLKGRVASHEGAVAAYNQALTDALHEVADQLQSLRAAAVQQEQLLAASQAAASSLEHVRRRERAGTANRLPVLAAEMTLLTQQRAELDSRARRADLDIGLIRALGGGFSDAGAGADMNKNIATYSAS
ncbi:MAG TPA: efflux transporter outer membrane subunit [Noviherbaspirillum sp.]|jgi:NodT family efflux transporter outer membrane factor (OMF) lipoprotein|uniref:efflux transporter outer membrane subunit n=1 Tax=Noviherbaspirillum sp. TaxID=1926288 RepID=UPI002F955106